MTTSTIIAIDGRPASPAMAAALEAIDRNCRAEGARKAERQSRIDNDPRIIARRAAKDALAIDFGYGVKGAQQLFNAMDDGRLARRSAIASLIKARIALINGWKREARQHIRDAMFARRSHWTNREALSAPVVAGAVNLAEAVA